MILKKKILSIILAFTMVFTLAACATTEVPTESIESPTPKSVAEPAMHDEVAPDTLDISWDNPDISWRSDTSPVTMTLFLDIPYLSVDVWGEDDVSKKITEDTGISFDVTKTIDNQQIHVVFASGDYPDIVYGDSIYNYANADTALAWDVLIEEYAPEFRYQLDVEEKFVNLRDDGHYYTIRSHFNRKQDYENKYLLPSGGEPTLHIRQDIMEELGNPELESLEDLLNIYEMVKENYPDLIPFLAYPGYPTTFKENFGFQRSADYDENGAYRDNFSIPGYIEYYKFMNTLYNEGYMPIESFSYKHEQFIQVVDNGDCFSMLFNTSLSDATNEKFDVRDVEGMRYVPVAKSLTVNGEDRMVIKQSWPGWATTIITKTNKHPDRSIRLMQYLYSDYGRDLTSWGIEGVHYNRTDDGLIESTELVLNTDPADRSKRFTGNWGFMAHEVWAGIGVYSKAKLLPQYSTALDVLKFKSQRIENDVIKSLVTLPPDSDLEVANTKINEIKNAMEIELITASDYAELEVAYDRIVDELQKAGLGEIEEYYTEKYKEAKVRYDNFSQGELEAQGAYNIVE